MLLQLHLLPDVKGNISTTLGAYLPENRGGALLWSECTNDPVMWPPITPYQMLTKKPVPKMYFPGYVMITG